MEFLDIKDYRAILEPGFIIARTLGLMVLIYFT